MLILSRKIGEAIVIPELHTTLTILRISGQRVRVGVKAPNDCGVYRDELWSKIQSALADVSMEPQGKSTSGFVSREQ